MVSSPYNNNNTFDRKVYSCCASTSSFTVTSPLTAHGRSQSSAPPACTDRLRIKMATEGQSEYESVLCVKPEVNVYRIPPRASNRAIRWGGEGQARRWGGVSWAAGDLRTELIRWPHRLRSGGRSFRAGVCFCCVITRSLRKIRNIAVPTIRRITGWSGFNVLRLFTFAISNDEHWHFSI